MYMCESEGKKCFLMFLGGSKGNIDLKTNL